jgi:hypothetical protein
MDRDNEGAFVLAPEIISRITVHQFSVTASDTLTDDPRKTVSRLKILTTWICDAEAGRAYRRVMAL